MKEDLPPDCDSQLDYASLTETLMLLEGEEVCLVADGGIGSRLQARGILRHYGYGWAEGFAIGDGARLLLSASDFASATLRTYDRTEHFSFAIHFRDLSYTLGDPGILESDEFDRYA